MTLSIAIVLIANGWNGWATSAWLAGGAAFAAIAIIGKAYWRPAILLQLSSTIGAKGMSALVTLLVAFNLALSALLVGLGLVSGLLWRALT